MCGIAGMFDTRGRRDFDRGLMQRLKLLCSDHEGGGCAVTVWSEHGPAGA